MPRHDNPHAAVTEADVLTYLSRSRKPQSLREIAAALGLRHSGRRALIKLAGQMKRRGDIHEYPNGRVGLPREKSGSANVGNAPKSSGAIDHRSGPERKHAPRHGSPYTSSAPSASSSEGSSDT